LCDHTIWCDVFTCFFLMIYSVKPSGFPIGDAGISICIPVAGPGGAAAAA
jgi:hypothetical protein